MDNYFEEIAEIIEDVADIDRSEIEEESLLMDDLNLSSLEIMALISRIEDKYDIKIDEKELLSIESVKDIMDSVIAKQ